MPIPQPQPPEPEPDHGRSRVLCQLLPRIRDPRTPSHRQSQGPAALSISASAWAS